ncbi:hypothetical protein L2725_07415 [Shewanella corallii]|uniref:Tetratricopeptide repeat protein n=1 Tax=Shewanella corallii TaxID=560080 RepID=A0ABT0N598_9GAMM|nr:hypothetical protein [Shewanella corallii]MCL2913617.1 hypothetical protein [Shewanella corallii]
MLLRVFTLLTVVMLAGCQSAQTPVYRAQVESLFLDQHFDTEQVLPAADTIFKLPPSVASEVRRRYERDKLGYKGSHNAHEWLSEFIRERDGGFEYRDHLTRGATETYARREGNCLSLVLLTTALADTLNVPVQYQEVEVQPIWDKWGQFYLINGHINIKLYAPESSTSLTFASRSILVDFLPERAIRGYTSHRINRSTVTAMFYNNLAAEALVNGDLDRAYALIKASLQFKPDFISAINTLGVVYRRAGMDDEAERVYRYAMALPGDHLNPMSNLALLLGEQGRLEEWSQIHRKLELARIRNPFYYFDMAEEAYTRKAYSEAVDWYRRAVKLADYQPEFFLGLSKSYWQLGDRDRAEFNMSRAIKLATDEEDKQRYQYKLKAMKNYAVRSI